MDGETGDFVCFALSEYISVHFFFSVRFVQLLVFVQIKRSLHITNYTIIFDLRNWIYDRLGPGIKLRDICFGIDHIKLAKNVQFKTTFLTQSHTHSAVIAKWMDPNKVPKLNYTVEFIVQWRYTYVFSILCICVFFQQLIVYIWHLTNNFWSKFTYINFELNE